MAGHETENSHLCKRQNSAIDIHRHVDLIVQGFSTEAEIANSCLPQRETKAYSAKSAINLSFVPLYLSTLLLARDS
jgi:hypothetical protein